MQWCVIIFNLLKYILQLFVLETVAISLITLSCTLNIFFYFKFFKFPQNKMPYFKDEWKF